MDGRVYARTLPSFRATSTEELARGIDRSIQLAACAKPITEHSVLAVAIAQVGGSDAFIAGFLGLCGSGGESQGQGDALVRECMRMAIKLSNAQLRFKNKGGKPGGAHALVAMKPVRLDKLDDAGARSGARALLIEMVKFTESGPPDASLVFAKRKPAIPTEVERLAYELAPASLGGDQAPLLEVVLRPNKRGPKVLEVREDVPMLLTPGLLNAVFGGA